MTKIDENTRMGIWDFLRFKLKIDTSKVINKNSLVKEIRSSYKLGKGQHAKGKQKSILGLIKKSDFWKQSRYADKYDFLPAQRVSRGAAWQKGEESLLIGLRKDYKGKALVDEYNKKVALKRSYNAIHVKASRLKGGA